MQMQTFAERVQTRVAFYRGSHVRALFFAQD